VIGLDVSTAWIACLNWTTMLLKQATNSEGLLLAVVVVQCAVGDLLAAVWIICQAAKFIAEAPDNNRWVVPVAKHLPDDEQCKWRWVLLEIRSAALA